MDADARRQIAAAMNRLADVRPRGKPVGEDDSTPFQTPPLLARYRRLAESYLKQVGEAT